MLKVLTKFQFIILLFITLSCRPFKNTEFKHSIKADGDSIIVEYYGKVDAVRFTMFGGEDFMLRKQSKNHFKGSFNIPNPEEAIFSFDIRVYLLDNSRNKLIDQKYKESKIGHNYFIYYGKNVNDIYLKSESIEGQLKDFRINSKNLDTTRSLTVYYPKHYNSITPIIYFTDGSNVIDYAKYVDKMISTGKIKPVILAGVHSSKNNRYFEYVQGDSNNTHFLNHERFFLHDVLNFIEHNIQNWKGKRYMYGVSNGGAFCIYMGINYPSLFKDIIAFSTAD